MKIRINTNENIHETEIAITCNHLTPEIEKLLSMIRMMNKQITGIKDGETHIVDVHQVMYIESVDKKTFLYTLNGVYETNLKLYELEDQLSDVGFIRVSKYCIINLKDVTSLKADFDRRIRVTLNNDEKLLVSRQYADVFKKRLGVH